MEATPSATHPPTTALSLRPQPSAILLRVHGALLGITACVGVAGGLYPRTIRALALLAIVGIVMSAPYWLLRRGRLVAMTLATATALGLAAMILPVAIRGEWRTPIAFAALTTMQIVGWLVLVVSRSFGAGPGVMEGLAATGIAGLALLLGWLAPVGTAPPMHYLVGDTHPDDQMLYRVQPYSQAVQFYPSNPRDYFIDWDGVAAPHWFAWQLHGGQDSTGRCRVDISPENDGTARLALSAITGAKGESFRWQCDRWPCKSPSELVVQFRARSDGPAAATIHVGGAGALLPHRHELQLSETWQRYHLEFLPYEGGERASVAFEIHGAGRLIELADFHLLCDGQSQRVAAPLTRHYVEYRMNSLGFRDRDYAVPRPALVFRIACLGDSFTLGQGVHGRDVYAKVLESLLEKRGPTPIRFEVINCGRSGYHSGNERVCYEREASRYQAQMVILQVYTNDFALDRSGESALPMNAAMTSSAEDYRRCVAEIELLHQRCQSNGAQLVVMLFRMGMKDFEWMRFLRLYESSATLKSVPLVDLGDALTAGSQGRTLEVHACDGHANELAHRLAAEALLQALEEGRLLPVAAARR